MRRKPSKRNLKSKRRQTITIEVDSENREIKSEFPLLRDGYTPSELITKFMNDALDTLKPTYLPKIKAITKRKGLLVNEVEKDEEIAAILKQRDVERRRLAGVMLDSFINRKSGRPKGRKKRSVKYSPQEFSAKLHDFVESYYKSEGEEPTQQLAAEALGLGYEKKLQRMRRSYGDNRHWKDFVEGILNKKK
jgi:hypothetical protein